MSETAFQAFEAEGRKVDRLLAHYGESHRNPTNELIHLVAIPAIMVSIVGLLYALHPWVAYAFVAAHGCSANSRPTRLSMMAGIAAK